MSPASIQLVRFGLVGLVNTAFAYMVFAALVLIGLSSLPALVLATLAGVVFNFQTATRLVFLGSPRRFLRFATLYAVVLGVNWAALRIASGLGISNLIAQALLAGPVAVFSFVVQKWVVFAPAPEAG